MSEQATTPTTPDTATPTADAKVASAALLRQQQEQASSGLEAAAMQAGMLLRDAEVFTCAAQVNAGRLCLVAKREYIRVYPGGKGTADLKILAKLSDYVGSSYTVDSLVWMGLTADVIGDEVLRMKIGHVILLRQLLERDGEWDKAKYKPGIDHDVLHLVARIVDDGEVIPRDQFAHEVKTLAAKSERYRSAELLAESERQKGKAAELASTDERGAKLAAALATQAAHQAEIADRAAAKLEGSIKQAQDDSDEEQMEDIEEELASADTVAAKAFTESVSPASKAKEVALAYLAELAKSGTIADRAMMAAQLIGTGKDAFTVLQSVLATALEKATPDQMARIAVVAMQDSEGDMSEVVTRQVFAEYDNEHGAAVVVDAIRSTEAIRKLVSKRYKGKADTVPNVLTERMAAIQTDTPADVVDEAKAAAYAAEQAA